MQSAPHFIGHALRSLVFALANSIPRLVVVVAFVMALFGCTPTIYVEPATSMSFLQTVETDSMLEARVKAHNLSALIRGDAPHESGTCRESIRLARREPICIPSRDCEST